MRSNSCVYVLLCVCVTNVKNCLVSNDYYVSTISPCTIHIIKPVLCTDNTFNINAIITVTVAIVYKTPKFGFSTLAAACNSYL